LTYACPAWEFATVPIYWNYSVCKISFFAPLVVFLGAHRSAICIWLSKFRTFTIT
jgi:hypothetical protein